MIKQVIVMRKDLNMRRGKMIAQGCHASLAVLLKNKVRDYNLVPNVANYTYCTFRFNDDCMEWLNNIFTKIVVSCNSEEELLSLDKKARESNLPHALIKDSGKTEFHGVPTYTCLAIGPAKAEDIDKLTGELKLL